MVLCSDSRCRADKDSGDCLALVQRAKCGEVRGTRSWRGWCRWGRDLVEVNQVLGLDVCEEAPRVAKVNLRIAVRGDGGHRGGTRVRRACRGRGREVRDEEYGEIVRWTGQLGL